MTRFLDGPAKSAILHLQRSPVMLRVVMKVVDQKPVFDALDQLGDLPEVGEKVYVYRLKSSDGFAHVDGRDKNGKRFARTYAICSYEYFAPQPSQDLLRDTKRWQEWCVELQKMETAK